MKHPLSFEASLWAEFNPLFRRLKCIIVMQPPLINCQRYCEKSFTFGCVLMSRIQTTFQKVEVYYLYSSHILICYILWKILYRWKHIDEQKADHFSECRILLYFKQPPYIYFLKYYEKFYIVGSAIMSRIQNSFQNVDVYYFYVAAIY